MFHVNEHYAAMAGSYLFAEISRRVAAFRAENPQADVISLGIGDVSRPLPSAVVAALHAAVDEMGQAESFRGYGPEQGYAFLREAIAAHDYAPRGVNLQPDEVFISDGAKCDVGNFQELFAPESVIAVTDPVYPVYVDSNAMAGRAGQWTGASWSNLVYLPCTAENGFVPDFPARIPDVIYFCYPNNPTGTVLTREALTAWVDFARKHGALIMYDAAYEAYISGPDVPHTIYEVPGAEEVAVEFRSYSKTAGFTGLRCGYVVAPKALNLPRRDGGRISLNALWNRRQTTKYNGCPYIVQRAAAAVYSTEGQREVREVLDGYMRNAGRIRQALLGMGLEVFGGEHAPYIWVRTPAGKKSWDFFQDMLERGQVVCTPGAGFGPSGEGYVRLTAFAHPERTVQALDRLRATL